MRTIIVHNPCNEHTRYYRNYNLFWDDLTDELKKTYQVKENRYYELANQSRYKVNLKNQTSCEDCFVLLECEYVIEFEDTGEFYIMSVSDDLTHAILNEQNNPFLKKVLISQFNSQNIQSHIDSTNIIKYSPWIYFPCTTYDLEPYYEKRKSMNNFIDKMYFRGTSISDRPIVTHINPQYLEGYHSIGGSDVYFRDLINYKIGLSVAGRGELCYRDIEYMCLGIPMLRFSYSCELNPKLIPNFHYISVDKPDDLLIDRIGNESHARLLEKRFLEVKDNKEFLDFISNNARKYYINYLSSKNRIQHTIQLLNM